MSTHLTDAEYHAVLDAAEEGRRELTGAVERIVRAHVDAALVEAERRVRAEPRQIVDRIRVKVEPAAEVAFTRAANIIRDLRAEAGGSDAE